MIKFKEKVFFWGTALTVGSTALSLGQGSKQMKESQKQADQMERSNMAIAKQLNKIANTNDPNKMASAGSLLQQNFSAGTLLRTVGGFAKDVGKVALKNKKALVGSAVFGVGMTAGSYLGDKYVQHDINKQQDKLKERNYSYSVIASKALQATKGIAKKIPGVLKEHKGSLLLSGGLGAAGAVLPHISEKVAQKDMISDTALEEKNYSFATIARTAKTAGSKIVNSAKFTYRHPGASMKRTGKALLGGTSSFMGGGGYSGVRKVGESLVAAGNASGNTITQKLGQTIVNNPNLAVAASIPVGSAILGAGYSAGEKVTKKALKTVDKNAFKHQEEREQAVQQGV